MMKYPTSKSKRTFRKCRNAKGEVLPHNVAPLRTGGQKNQKRLDENETRDLVRKKMIGSPRMLRRRTIGLCGDAESNFPPTKEAHMIAHAICEFMMRSVDERRRS